jgi:predicted amidohydrolase
MRLTILELPARWNDTDEMLASVDNMVRPETDLVLLPEASLHGYLSPEGDADLTRFAEPIDGPTSRACAAIAAKHRVHLVAPLVLREGATLQRDDRHARQHAAVRLPQAPPVDRGLGARVRTTVVTIAGRVVTLAICYDVHFLPRESAAQLEAADVLLFPSAWVEEPDLRIPRLQRLAHAFELTIANANWGPGQIVVPGQGNSCVVAPDRTIVAKVADGRIDLVL